MTIARVPYPYAPDYSDILKEYQEQEGMITKGNGKTDGVDLKKRTISGWISRIEGDRDTEVVIPTAFEKNLDIYLENGPLLLFHNHKSLPVGKILEAKIYPNEGVWGKFYITKNPIGDEILNLVDEGILNGFSAGFVPVVAEENPSLSRIPNEALKTLNGKKVRKLYREVEWVETSLLPIPSNRGALIDRAEKGNSVANIIVKAFDAENQENFELVLKEWVAEKAFWDESEHPRSNDGKFTTSSHVNSVLDPIRESNYYPSGSTSVSTNRAANESVRKIEESNKKLDELSEKQDRMNSGVNRISDHTSWGNWFAKYAIVIASVIGSYMLYKHGKKVSMKGFDDDSRVMNLLDILKNYLTKGEELGFTDTEEYQKTKKFYNNARKTFQEKKGLSSLFITEKSIGGLSSLFVGKEMTPETFVEEEHPRHADGKFRKKSEGTGVKNAKVEEISHEIEEVKDNNNEGIGKTTAISLGILVGTIEGYKLFSKSNIFQWAIKNRENSKDVAINILGSAITKGKITKTSQDIFDLQISKKFFDKNQYLLPNEKEVFNYLDNPIGLQKDIFNSFNHLNLEFNCKKIFISNKSPYNFPKSYDEFLKCSTNYNIAKNEITVSVSEMAMINDMLKLSPKQIILHEYAHSLAMNNSDLMIKHEKEFTKMAEKLIGKKVYTPNPNNFSEPLIGKITDIKIVDLDLEKEFRQAFDQMKSMGIKVNYKDLEKYKKIKTKTVLMTMKGNGKKDEITMWNIMLRLQGMGMTSFNADSFFKIEGHSYRELYGFRELSEYIAIKAEKGEKI